MANLPIFIKLICRVELSVIALRLICLSHTSVTVAQETIHRSYPQTDTCTKLNSKPLRIRSLGNKNLLDSGAENDIWIFKAQLTKR